MRRRLFFVLGLFVLLSSLLYVRFNLVEVKAPNGDHVHNLNTGLNYTTIQEAIDANETLDGHTIFVEEGIYYEHVFVGKELTLIGENRDTTIIDGNETGPMGTIWLTSINSSITGFTIRNGEFGIQVRGGFGFLPTFTGHRIENNCIVENLCGAILLQTCANNTISNNIIKTNTLFGIHIWSSANNTIINNTVVNNGHGVDFYGNSNGNILRNNNMTDNTYNFGLIARGETHNWVFGQLEKPGIVNDVDVSNTVNGKPIYYLVNQSDVQVPSDAGYVWLNNCTNITVNGCDLSHNLQGVLLVFCDNASITNNNMADNVYGIYVGVYSNNNTLVGNTLDGNLHGVYLHDFSRFTTMRNNNIHDGDMNFGVSPDIGLHGSDWSGLVNDIDTSNTVDGKPIIYWINQHEQKVPTSAGYVMLINCTNILVKGLNLSNNVQNVFVISSNNTVIANNSITNSIYGIDVSGVHYLVNSSTLVYYDSFNTTVGENLLVDNGVGVRIRSGDSIISNNTLIRNPLGIYVTKSYSAISRNVVVASGHLMPNPGPPLDVFYYPEWELSKELQMYKIGGIIVEGASNLIYGNTVMDSWIGITSASNFIIHNNLINNTLFQAQGSGLNLWFSDYPSGGNYWSNYTGSDQFSGPYQNQTGSDGIGDIPYVINANNQDYYPLMAPISIFDAGTWNDMPYNVEIISNSTVSGFYFNPEDGAFLRFNVTGDDGTKGFCRVTIPKDLLWAEGEWTIIVSDKQITDYTVMQDVINTYLYFTYNHSTKTVQIQGTHVIPEFPSFIILPLFMIVTLLAAIIHRRKHSLKSH